MFKLRSGSGILFYFSKKPDVREIEFFKTSKIEKMNNNRDRQGKKREEEFGIDETHWTQIYGIRISQTRLIRRERNQILPDPSGQNDEDWRLTHQLPANHLVFC